MKLPTRSLRASVHVGTALATLAILALPAVSFAPIGESTALAALSVGGVDVVPLLLLVPVAAFMLPFGVAWIHAALTGRLQR